MILDMEIRICVLYEYKLRRNVPVAFENLSRAFGDGAISRESVYRWYNRFRKGNLTLEDERGPFSVINDDDLKKYIEQYPFLSLRELAKRFGVGRTAIRYHLNKIADGKRVRYDPKKVEDAKKRRQRIPVDDGEQPTLSLEAAAKKEEADVSTVVGIAETQDDSKKGVPTMSQEKNEASQQKSIAKDCEQSNSSQSEKNLDGLSKYDENQQQIRVDTLLFADGSRETKECVTYLF